MNDARLFPSSNALVYAFATPGVTRSSRVSTALPAHIRLTCTTPPASAGQTKSSACSSSSWLMSSMVAAEEDAAALPRRSASAVKPAQLESQREHLGCLDAVKRQS